MTSRVRFVLIWVLLISTCSAFAQQPAPRGQGGQEQTQARPPAAPPPLFFKEAWKQTPEGGEHPVSLDVVSNPNLELKLYGAGKDILVNGAAGNERNPIRLWTESAAQTALLRSETRTTT